MAVTDYVPDIFGGMPIFWVASLVGLIIFFFILIWYVIHRWKIAPEYGTSKEKKVEAKAGKNYVEAEEAIKKIEASEEAEEKEEEHIEKEEEAEEKEEKKAKAPEETIKETKASEESAKAVEEETKAAKEAAAVEGRAIGLIAALQETLSSAVAYVYYRKKTEAKEEQEIPIIEDLMKRIKNTVNHADIDSRALKFVKEYFDKLLADLKAVLDDEKKKEEEMEGLLKNVKEAVAEMAKVIRGARKALTKLQKDERKERKHYDKEMKDIEKAIKAKEKKLRTLKKKGKKANPEVVAALAREIALAKSQAKTARQINKKLKDTYKFMKKEIKEMKKLLRKILKSDKSQKRYWRKLKKREGQVEKRFNKLEKSFDEIRKQEGAFAAGATPQTVAVEISPAISGFFEKLKEVAKEDLSFDKQAKSIATENIVLAKQMEAFEKLEQSLTESEEAVEKGAGAVTQLISAISSNTESKVAAKKIIDILKKESSKLEYEKKIQKYMEEMDKRIEQQSSAMTAQIDSLIQMDEKTIAEAEAGKEDNMKHIGNSMATIAARKEAVDKTYRPKATAFGQQLEKRNTIAAAAYKQAIRAERKAA